MKTRFGRPHFEVWKILVAAVRRFVIDIPVLSELNPLKMASSSSAVNDSVILTENDIPGASLAGRNPSSLKNEELRFWLRCRGDSLKGLNTNALLVKRYAQCIDFNSSLTVISYNNFFLIRFAEWRNT